MKHRFFCVTKKYLLLLILGISYLIWVLLTDLRIPCIFNLLFKLKCPGCGVTRMIASLARLDFYTAFLCNPFLFVTAPIILLLIAYSELAYVQLGTHSLGRLNPLLYLELTGALIFGVIRNVA